MTRVLSVEPAGGLWGSERALLDLISAARDLEIAVCCPPNSPLQIELERRGIRTLPWFVAELHRKPRWLRLQAALGVVRACATFRPDVIHLNQSGAYRTALPAAVLMKLPVVCHVRIFEDVAYLAQRAAMPRRLKALVAISGAVEAEIKQFSSLRTIPVHLIYDAYAQVYGELGGKPLPGRFACVGRITPIKGQDVLLRALQMAKLFDGEVEGLIVGEGEAEYVHLLQQMAPRSGPVRTTWTGFLPEVAPLLRTCCALVCSSHREPLGRVIFEAWDAGAVPVVFAGAGGAAEVVLASDGGLVYSQQTPESLARALAEALKMGEQERARLVANGRAWMRKNCALEPYGRALAAVLEQVSA